MGSAEACVVVLAVTLALSCVSVAGIAVYLLVRFSHQLSLPNELAVRRAAAIDVERYSLMAIADQAASGRRATDAKLEVPPGLLPQKTTDEQPQMEPVPMSDGFPVAMSEDQ